MCWTTIRTFKTARFTVKLQWQPEQDSDLSWMDYSDRARLESGEWTNCTFRVVVFLDGSQIAAEYLGNSVYADPDEFAHEHYGTAGTGMGSYFPQMLREATREARQRVKSTALPAMRGTSP